MNKLLFLALATSFILSACASLQPAPTTATADVALALPPAATADSTDHDQLSSSLAEQQQRLQALEFKLAQLQNQVNTLEKNHGAPAAPPAPPPSEPAPPKAKSDQDILQQAQRQLQQQEYVAMVSLLKNYANGGNGSQSAQGNMFLLSAAHFHLGNCETAINIGRRFANDFKQHPDASKALYNIANCQLSMKQNDVAKTTLRNLIRTYPNSNEAQRAKILLK